MTSWRGVMRVATMTTPLAAVLFASVLALGGCSEAVINQYTKLGKWTRPADAPQVISGTPEVDRKAVESSEQTFTEADWQILERLAPRPVWERIANARAKLSDAPAEPATKPSAVIQTRAEAIDEVAEYVTITELPDKKLRMLCPLRHVGGVTVSSKRAGGTDRRNITVTPVDLKPFVDMVSKQLGDKGSCAALPSENALVVTCDEAQKQSVLSLLADVDRPARQVDITARIFEVSHEFDFELGARTVLEHVGSSNTQALASRFNTKGFLDSLASGGAAGFQGSALRLFQIFGGSGLSADVTFEALANTGYIREVASPRMTVVAGQTGYMLAGQELPISSARLSNDRVITEKTTYKPIGVQLYITPQVVGGDSVKLHVVTIVSSIAGFSPRMAMDETDKAQALINPVIDSREAETSVTVPDRSTLVIGGLRMIRHITRERKIPGLGDIWGMEWLFKNHRSQRQLNDLYFFVTPRVVN